MLRVENPHSLTVEEVLQRLDTDPEVGLSEQAAAERLAEVGPNVLPEPPKEGLLVKFVRQFSDFLVILLLVAVVLSAALGEYKDAAVITLILLLNAALGLWQEVRAEKAMKALKEMQVPQCTVLREGKQRTLPATDLVPGDVLILQSGDKIPADARLVEAASLATIEAALTGESTPTDKQAQVKLSPETPLGDRANLLFMGTAIARGRGKALVTATGQETELGHIATLLSEEADEATPLQRRVSTLGKQLGIAALGVCVVVFAAGVFHHQPLTEMFLAAVSLAVAAIPEGLPAVIAINLALGAQQMAKSNALVRKLPAVETLGSITVICTDKTGTLTQNKMTVVSTVAAGEPLEIPETTTTQALPETVDLLLKAACLCNDATLEGETSTGDPTEVALLAAARQFSYYKEALSRKYPRLWEMPFDSRRKFMVTCHRAEEEGELLVFVKGAAERVLELCSHQATPAGRVPLSPEEKTALLQAVNEEAAKARRVLAFACKRLPLQPADELSAAKVAGDLLYLGYMAMVDPPREEVPDAVAECKGAGIRPVMITGDHPVTALAIAKEVGLAPPDATVCTGLELDRMDVNELADAARNVSVFARVSPVHKLKLIRAYKADRHIVAMTGDGVNDAPALKSADIGVAMGIQGTDVSKDAADLVLADDNFATIVKAIEQGRVIFDNIAKFVRYMVSTNTGEILTMFFSMVLGLGLPLWPIHLLWINLVTDGPPALALGVSPAEPDLMKRPPRSPEAGVIDKRTLWNILTIGILMAAGSLLALEIGKDYALHVLHLDATAAHDYGQTMCFTTLVMFQLFHALNCQWKQRSLFGGKGRHNRWVYLALVLGVVLQLIVIYVPHLHDWFHTQVLDFQHLGLAVAIAFSVIIVEELTKLLMRLHAGRSRKRQEAAA